VEALKAALQRIAAGLLELGLGLEPAGGEPLPITSSRMGHLLDALGHGYRVLGLEDPAGGDDVFRQMVLARIIEPASKLDSLRVLEEAGIAAASYATVKRRLPTYAQEDGGSGCRRPAPRTPGSAPAERRGSRQMSTRFKGVPCFSAVPRCRCRARPSPTWCPRLGSSAGAY
jgi:hypothetical protein